MATVFQKLAVDHVPFPLRDDLLGTAAPLDYPNLRKGGFELVYFRPEEGAEWISQRIKYAQTQPTFRGFFSGGVWYADPSSEDSIKYGIPTGPQTWADHVVMFVKALRAKGFGPKIVKLNIETTGKGYPPWKGGVEYPPWSKVYASALSPEGEQRYYLFYTPNGGKSGLTRPKFSRTGITRDGAVNWQPEDGKVYANAGGWNWNELAAARYFGLLKDQPTIIQPLSMQDDFNHGAWMRRGARNSPQCYGSQPYIGLTDPGLEIDVIEAHRYSRLYYGYECDRRLVHPTIGAYGQSSTYKPNIVKARKKGPFGFSIFRHDAFQPSDFSDYRDLVVP